MKTLLLFVGISTLARAAPAAEVMNWLDLDPAKSRETRKKVAAWTPDSKVNVEELGHYYEVCAFKLVFLFCLHYYYILLLQGDILRHPPVGRNGIIDESYHWPDGEVPYVFAINDFSEVPGFALNEHIYVF